MVDIFLEADARDIRKSVGCLYTCSRPRNAKRLKIADSMEVHYANLHGLIAGRIRALKSIGKAKFRISEQEQQAIQECTVLYSKLNRLNLKLIGERKKQVFFG